MSTSDRHGPHPGGGPPAGRGQDSGRPGDHIRQGHGQGHAQGHGKDHPRLAKNVDWEVYDVPRIWQMVASEGGAEADSLVMAFNKVSQYVDDTRLRLTEAGKALSLAWSGSAAADLAQAGIAEITGALLKDTAAYVTATRELGNVVDRLTESKQRIAPLYDQWLRLSQVPDAGIFTRILVESDAYQNKMQQTNNQAREEMRRLDRDLSGARITTTDEYVPATGMPSTNDLQLAGLGPQAIEAARGGRGGLLAGGLPQPASVVPGAGSSGLISESGSAPGVAGRASVPGVIGGDATGNRPMAGGMMGGAMGGGRAGATGGQSGKANLKWSARSGVDPVIDGTPPPDPSTMGVDDSFDRQQRRSK